MVPAEMKLSLTLEPTVVVFESITGGDNQEYRQLTVTLWGDDGQGQDYIDSVVIDKDDLLWLLGDKKDEEQ